MGAVVVQAEESADRRSRISVLSSTPDMLKWVAKRSLWGIVSQGAGSVGNLAVCILVARAASASDFGAWGLGYGIYVLAMGAARAASGTPLLLSNGGDGNQRSGASPGSTLGVYLGVAVLASTIVACLALGVDRHGGVGLWILAATLPPLLAHDAARFCFFARGEPGRAAACDLVRLVVQLAGFAALLSSEADVAWHWTAVWGLSALVALPGLAILHAWPTPSGTATYLRKNVRAILPLSGDFVVTTVVMQSIPFLLALIAGLEATAGLRVGLVLLGPLNVVITGVTPVVTVEAVKHVDSRRRLTVLVGSWSLAIALGACMCGLVLSVLPSSAGRSLAGQSWDLASPLIFALALQAALSGPLIGAQVALNAMMRLRESFRLRMQTIPPMLVLPVVGMLIADEEGAAWGIAAGAGLASVLAIQRIFRLRVDGECDAAPIPARDTSPFERHQSRR
ncbi:hypothetical protein ABN028_18885 [Actinopolymorpha sp. B17G11]|uniref:hypothetical protein n=1 Tax=Actinopolymorpha sp. B17G11 TaxID=3160861 RepID=UPI0032E52E8E